MGCTQGLRSALNTFFAPVRSKLPAPRKLLLSTKPRFLEIAEKITCPFGHNVQKYRLVNTVAASFNTSMGQMTEMLRRKNTRTK